VTSATSTHAVRHPASDFPSITGLTLLPQSADASLVNLSTTGLLSESTARVPVSSPVIVKFRGTFSPGSVVGRVVRCEVAAMGKDGILHYNIAIQFASPITLGDENDDSTSQRRAQQAVLNRW
jgi:hypothetical protein